MSGCVGRPAIPGYFVLWTAVQRATGAGAGLYIEGGINRLGGK